MTGEKRIYELYLDEWDVGYLLGVLQGRKQPRIAEVKRQLEKLVEAINKNRQEEAARGQG